MSNIVQLLVRMQTRKHFVIAMLLANIGFLYYESEWLLKPNLFISKMLFLVLVLVWVYYSKTFTVACQKFIIFGGRRVQRRAAFALFFSTLSCFLIAVLYLISIFYKQIPVFVYSSILVLIVLYLYMAQKNAKILYLISNSKKGEKVV